MGIPVPWVLEYVLEGGWARPSGGFIPLTLGVLTPWRGAVLEKGQSEPSRFQGSRKAQVYVWFIALKKIRNKS